MKKQWKRLFNYWKKTRVLILRTLEMTPDENWAVWKMIIIVSQYLFPIKLVTTKVLIFKWLRMSWKPTNTLWHQIISLHHTALISVSS